MSKYQDPQIVNPSDGKTYEPPLTMPNKGTGVGFIPGHHDSAGYDMAFESTNRIKGISAACESDPMEQCYADQQQRSNEPGRRDSPVGGKSITSACDSDAKDDDTPKDQRY